MTRRILLISSSTCRPTGYLDHAKPEIRDFLGGTRRVLFFPWALLDRDAYAAKVRERLGRMGFEVDSAQRVPGPGPRGRERRGGLPRRRKYVSTP
ncbi:MAG TPA: Type 1 glutamine amidotransferase-like domain-containing protein [Thermoanaerobaculia bacterium]|jgi:peptidase E